MARNNERRDRSAEREEPELLKSWLALTVWPKWLKVGAGLVLLHLL